MEYCPKFANVSQRLASLSARVLFIASMFADWACHGATQPDPTHSEASLAKAPPPASTAPQPVAPPVPQLQNSGHEADLRRGAELYTRMCAVCHGVNGEGYKADQATALAHPDFLASVSDDLLGYSILNGRPGTTMSAWFADRGGPLSMNDIRALVTFIRSWQKLPAAVLDERPVTGDIQRGRTIFQEGCERCHAAKGPYVRIQSREFLSHVSAGFLRNAIRKGRAPTVMPSFETTLGERGIEDVVAYLRSLPAGPAADAVPRPPPPLPLGPVPLNEKGPEPRDFNVFPKMTSVDIVHTQLKRKARLALLDARAPSDYASGHIAGAVSVPFYDPTPYLTKLPKNAWLVCYCGCPHAESGTLATKLMAAGFKKVTVLDEGLGVWTERGYPTQVGIKP